MMIPEELRAAIKKGSVLRMLLLVVRPTMVARVATPAREPDLTMQMQPESNASMIIWMMK